jgi:hypothetical protein
MAETPWFSYGTSDGCINHPNSFSLADMFAAKGSTSARAVNVSSPAGSFSVLTGCGTLAVLMTLMEYGA